MEIINLEPCKKPDRIGFNKNSITNRTEMKKELIVVIYSLLMFSCVSPRIINYSASNERLETKNVHDSQKNLSVMSWNIKFGGGRVEFALDCIGDQKNMTKEEVLNNLDSISKLLNVVRPDVVLIQEIDRKAKRSQKIDQVKYILDHSDYLKYGIYSSQWKFGGRLFWKFGSKMNTGNAMLSRYNFLEANTKLLPGDRILMFKRHMQKATIQVGMDTLRLINLHAAVGGGLKAIEKTIDMAKNEIVISQLESYSIVVGGDFNAIPPGNPICQGFKDAKCDCLKSKGSNYCAKKMVMLPMYKMDYINPAIDENNAILEKNRTCSLDSAEFWTRKLDYLFTNTQRLDGVTIQRSSNYLGNFPEPMSLSDHAPLLMNIQLSSRNKK